MDRGTKKSYFSWVSYFDSMGMQSAKKSLLNILWLMGLARFSLLFSRADGSVDLRSVPTVQNSDNLMALLCGQTPSSGMFFLQT
jgi:hypothetical protein